MGCIMKTTEILGQCGLFASLLFLSGCNSDEVFQQSASNSQSGTTNGATESASATDGTPTSGDDYAPARRVGARVVTKGRLTRQSPPLAVPQRRRQGLRRIVTHVPADPHTAAMPGVRLGHALRRGEDLDTQSRLLGALFRLTGLESVLALDGSERRRAGRASRAAAA